MQTPATAGTLTTGSGVQVVSLGARYARVPSEEGGATAPSSWTGYLRNSQRLIAANTGMRLSSSLQASGSHQMNHLHHPK